MKRAALILAAAAALTAHADALQWVSHVTPDVTPANVLGLGTAGNPGLEAGVFFPATALTEHKGKEMQVLALYAAAPSTQVTVFVKNSNTRDGGSYLRRQILSDVAVGWNYYLFPKPATVPDNEGIVIGYSMKEDYNRPVAFDGATPAAFDNQYFKIDMSPATLLPEYGNLLVGMLVGGDTAQLGNRLTIAGADAPAYVNSGESVDIALKLINPSFTDVTSMTVVIEKNGAAETVEHTFATPVAKNDDGSYLYTIPSLQQTAALRFTISAVNGVPLAAPQSYETTVNCVRADDAVPRKLLIEEFGGQLCQNCPRGEEDIEEATENLGDLVVRVSHHSGYYPDMFTLNECLDIASLYGVTSAPSVLVDRVAHPSMGINTSLVWDPTYMTEELLLEALATPAYITVDVSSRHDNGTYTVKATGRATADIASPMLHMLLIQNGYVALQYMELNVPNPNYVHNNFPVAYLTGAFGEPLTLASDGTYAVEHTVTLPATLTNAQGSFNVTPDKMMAVAFITQGSADLAAARVHNANWAPLGSSSNAAIDNVETLTDIDVYIADGRVVCSLPGATLRAYDALGRTLDTDALTAHGLVIVNVTAPDGRQYSTKLLH